MPASKKNNLQVQFVELFDKTYKYLALAAAIAVLVVGWMWLLSPQFETLKAAPEQIAQMDQQIRILDQKRLSLAKNPSQLAALTPVEEKILEWFLPSSMDFTSLVIHFINFFKNNGFVISGITVAEDANGSGSSDPHLKKISLSLPGISVDKYDDLRNFLNILGTSIMPLQISAISLPLSDITLTTYFYQ